MRSRWTKSLISLHHVLLQSFELAFFIVRNPDTLVLLIVLETLHLLIPNGRQQIVSIKLWWYQRLVLDHIVTNMALVISVLFFFNDCMASVYLCQRILLVLKYVIIEGISAAILHLPLGQGMRVLLLLLKICLVILKSNLLGSPSLE